MIKKYLPFILLGLGIALIAYMHCTHNNSCCAKKHDHKHDHVHHPHHDHSHD